MDEDSGYFSRRSNEFRLPAQHHSYNLGSTKPGCCCSNNSFSHNNGSPKTSYECHYVGSPICDSDDITAASPIKTNSDSSYCCHCDSSCNSSSYNNNNINSSPLRDNYCPYLCGHHHHHHHNYYHRSHDLDPQTKSPCTVFDPNYFKSYTQPQQQTWNECGDPHNNNPRDKLSPLSSELISSSSLAYPGSGLAATNTSIDSRRNSGGHLYDNNTSASSVGYQNNSSSLVGRARFSPDDILKLGYEDLLKCPSLKRFSYGFQDEQEFEDFKQDLRDFQLYKRESKAKEDTLPLTHSSSGYTCCEPSGLSFRNLDSGGYSTFDENIPGGGYITNKGLIDNKDSQCIHDRQDHQHHHHHHLSDLNPNRNTFCKIEKENYCDHDYNDDRREVKRNVTFSSFNADRSGRIIGTDILKEYPNSTTDSPPSANLSKFSQTFNNNNNHNSFLAERNTPVSPFSFSPSSDKKKQHGSLSVKRHSPRSLPSFQHLTQPSKTTSAPHDMLMDFFKSDEHFQEFEREFANLGRDFDVFNRLRRVDGCEEDGDSSSSRPAARGIERSSSSSSSGSATPFPIQLDSSRGTESSISSGSCTPIPIHVDHRPAGEGSREPTPRSELMVRAGDSSDVRPTSDEVDSFFHKDDSFSDFFNNDEDFKEFEREFANFKLKRRSRAFADDFNRRSNCDLFADLFPGFESQSPRERRSRGSASDWDYLFNKIKRNSNIFSEPTQCLSDGNANEESTVFLPNTNDISRTSAALPQSHYQDRLAETQPRTPRKTVEIAIQRRPPLPASPARRLSPEVTRSPGLKRKPLELKIEHVSSPCSSPTCSSTSSPRTPTGVPFVPRPRTDSPLLLHINEDNLRDSSPIRRVLQFDDLDENDEEPTTPTNADPTTMLHIDELLPAEKCNDSDDDEHIVIEHRFSEGISQPTTTITRRTKGSSSLSERSASPASPLAVRRQQSQPRSNAQQYQVPSSEIRDRRRFTDPSRIVIERRFDGRDSEPESCKQNRFSTALEFLHDVDATNKPNNNTSQHKPHDKDCQYTCHEKCRQLVTLDCKNSLPNSGSDGSIETSLSEPASTPGSNSTISDTSPNDETDSGYRSGPIPEEILPKKQPSQATLNREELKRKLQEYNNNVPFANLAMESDGETFQGFIKVTLNLIRPITMSLGARPPSIYEVLTREHIVEQNTQSISFYMPRDTVKSIHVDSETTTKEVISALLKKFKILDNPRKFAMYEQELQNGKIVKLRRVLGDEFPLQVCLGWGTENLQAHRLVLQENEATGDIEWSNFSSPELNNFLKVLDREQEEHINQLQYKYRMMKKVILQRLKEIRKCRNDASPTSPSTPTGSNGNHSPGGQTQKVI